MDWTSARGQGAAEFGREEGSKKRNAECPGKRGGTGLGRDFLILCTFDTKNPLGFKRSQPSKRPVMRPKIILKTKDVEGRRERSRTHKLRETGKRKRLRILKRRESPQPGRGERAEVKPRRMQ